MLDFMPRPRRYSEPDADDQKYVGIRTKTCTVCGRELPDHPDFFSKTSSVSPNDRSGYRYQYRRRDCRSCRSDEMRRQREGKAIIEERL